MKQFISLFCIGIISLFCCVSGYGQDSITFDTFDGKEYKDLYEARESSITTRAPKTITIGDCVFELIATREAKCYYELKSGQGTEIILDAVKTNLNRKSHSGYRYIVYGTKELESGNTYNNGYRYLVIKDTHLSYEIEQATIRYYNNKVKDLANTIKFD